MKTDPAGRFRHVTGLFLIAAAVSLASLLAASPLRAEEAKDPHAAMFDKNSYPTAAQCGQCHTQIYREWASSNHAYASISPMFHKFEQTITDLSSGTIGTFCVRCHQQVGTQRGEDRADPLWARSDVSREGVTCITCHRVSQEFGKVNGERTIDPGDISHPVTGTAENSKLNDIIADKDAYRVATSPQDRGIRIHSDGVFKFEQIGTSQFCVSCHQVAVHPGIKLEVVWEQFRNAPAAAAGVQCQECHMGAVPGVVSGYTKAPSAVISGKPVNPDREHHNHAFYGPGYPIAHPGLFPQNPKAQAIKIEDWLRFDYRAGWGTSDFEDKVSSGELKVNFPDRWSDETDREDVRAIIDENLKMLDEKKKLRQQVMENGSKIDGPFFRTEPRANGDLKFDFKVTNINPGHNMPSGSLGAQPEIWVNVALTGPDGKKVWESGYVDSYGDMADLHSRDVRAGKLAHDDQLVNLQTKFLTTNIKGTDREMYLPVNFDIDQIPFIRPATVPTTVLNHPPFIRMEARSIPPLGERLASYSVPGRLLTMPGKYRLTVRMRSRAEPMYFMSFVKATTDMEQAMNQWMIDIHPYSVSFDVK